jgi:hypothetical protein
MITKIGEKDRFGYDDRGTPAVVQIDAGFFVSGYLFCDRLKAVTDAGFQDGGRLFSDGTALLYLFSPTARAAEMWGGKWTKDDFGYSVVNPQYLGVIDRDFSDFNEVRVFFQAPQPSINIRPEYLTVDGGTQPHSDVIADREYAINLAKTPRRFPEQRIDRSKIAPEEAVNADDINFLIHNLYGYAFRFDAASKLMSYANTLHFSRPQFIPASEANFFISMEWRQMAARDAAFSLYHFQQTFELLREQALRSAPKLLGSIDVGKLRIAWRLFHSWFKDVVPMRNALGHAGEFYSTTKERSKHGSQRNVFLEFIIVGHMYSVESHGRQISLDLSQTAAQRLERIKSLIDEALSAIMEPPRAPGAQSSKN